MNLVWNRFSRPSIHIYKSIVLRYSIESYINIATKELAEYLSINMIINHCNVCPFSSRKPFLNLMTLSDCQYVFSVIPVGNIANVWSIKYSILILSPLSLCHKNPSLQRNTILFHSFNT